MGEYGALRAETGVDRANRALDALGPFGTFAGIVPPVFDAAVRILHLVEESGGRTVRWREVAEVAGTVLHPLAQWERLVGEHSAQYGPPRTGVLPLDELAVLAGALARHTTTPESCLAAFWEGFGVLTGGTSVLLTSVRGDPERPAWLDDDRPTGGEHPEIAAAASIGLPGRDCLLLSLDVRALADRAWARESGFADAPGLTEQTPTALWPEDLAWYLASEIDFDSTVIGGSRALVDEIVALAAEGSIEALELPDEVDLTSAGDTVNRPRG